MARQAPPRVAAPGSLSIACPPRAFSTSAPVTASARAMVSAASTPGRRTARGRTGRRSRCPGPRPRSAPAGWRRLRERPGTAPGGRECSRSAGPARSHRRPRESSPAGHARSSSAVRPRTPAGPRAAPRRRCHAACARTRRWRTACWLARSAAGRRMPRRGRRPARRPWRTPRRPAPRSATSPDRSPRTRTEHRARRRRPASGRRGLPIRPSSAGPQARTAVRGRRE